MRIAIVVEPDFDGLEKLSSHVPVWIVGTPHNRRCAETIWDSSPEGPLLTTYEISKPDSRLENLLNVIPDVELHHYGVTELLIVGLENSEGLRSGLRQCSYELTTELPDGWLATRNGPARPH